MRPHIEDGAGEGMQVLKFGNDEFSKQIDMTNSDKPLENGRWKDNLTEVTEVSLLVSVGITQDLQLVQAVSFTKKDSWFDEAVSLVKVRFQLSLLHFSSGSLCEKHPPNKQDTIKNNRSALKGFNLKANAAGGFHAYPAWYLHLRFKLGLFQFILNKLSK